MKPELTIRENLVPLVEDLSLSRKEVLNDLKTNYIPFPFSPRDEHETLDKFVISLAEKAETFEGNINLILYGPAGFGKSTLRRKLIKILSPIRETNVVVWDDTERNKETDIDNFRLNPNHYNEFIFHQMIDDIGYAYGYPLVPSYIIEELKKYDRKKITENYKKPDIPSFLMATYGSTIQQVNFYNEQSDRGLTIIDAVSGTAGSTVEPAIPALDYRNIIEFRFHANLMGVHLGALHKNDSHYYQAFIALGYGHRLWKEHQDHFERQKLGLAPVDEQPGHCASEETVNLALRLSHTAAFLSIDYLHPEIQNFVKNFPPFADFKRVEEIIFSIKHPVLRNMTEEVYDYNRRNRPDNPPELALFKLAYDLAALNNMTRFSLYSDKVGAYLTNPV